MIIIFVYHLNYLSLIINKYEILYLINHEIAVNIKDIIRNFLNNN